MKYCKECGLMMADDAAVCPGCGAAQPAPQPQYASAAPQSGNAQNEQNGQNPQQPPVYSRGYEAQYEAAPHSYTAPAAAPDTLSTGGYLLTLIVMMIPLIGFIMQLVWSFGGSKNTARQSLARAYLIRSVIFGVIGVLVGLLVFSALAVVGSQLYYGYSF